MKNLLNESDISELYKRNPEIFSGLSSIGDAISTLKIFSELNISPLILNFNNSTSISLDEHGMMRLVPIKEILNFAKKLILLKQCPGFESLSNGINNQTQLFDTMFEVDCAHFVFTTKSIKKLELSPEIKVNGKIKKPDFSFVMQNGMEIFCECKSLESAHRAKNSKATRLIPYLDPILKDLIPKEFRIEIALRILPNHWRENYSTQLSSVINQLIKYKFTKNHFDLYIDGKEIAKIKLSLIHEQPYFKCLINVGNRPPHENPNLIIGEITNLQKDIKNSIKDAITQLPGDKFSMIFLNSLNENQAEQTIRKFFTDNIKENICGVFSKTTGFKYHKNSNSAFNITL